MSFSPHPVLDRILSEAQTALWRRDPAGVFRMEALGACEGEGICVWQGGQGFSAGVVDEAFTLMSAVKPFLLRRVLEVHGAAAVAGWVDDLPSAMPYYSLEQLRQDGGKPRNAMINSGAMLLASKLPGADPEEQMSGFVRWLEALAPGVRPGLDAECLAEVLAPGGDPTNLALAQALENAGHLPNAALAYEVYFRLCCLTATLEEITRLAAALACVDSPHRDRIVRTLSRAGLYEDSEAWWRLTGMPAKSGVSGVMFGLLPDGGAVAACSPWLAAGGNPILPMQVLAELAHQPLKEP
jgi:glutaminase